MKSSLYTFYNFLFCFLSIEQFCALIDGFSIHRVVGGHVVSIENYPFMASLRYDNYHFCGGSIISTNVVLTAAHCVQFVKQEFKRITVVVGENLSDTVTESNKYNIQGIWQHSGFNDPIHLENDIAIIKVVRKFTFGPSIQMISLGEDEPFCKEMLTIVGWGETSQRFGRESVNNLQAAKLPMVCLNDCITAYYQHFDYILVNDKKICAGYRCGGIDSCQGDSGGPVVYKGELVGVISSGIGCADGHFPGINTKVSAYRNWIMQFIE